MNFNKHSNLEGRHSFLSPSKYHWINYDLDKLRESYLKHAAALKGTQLHAFAAMAIKLRQKMPKSDKTLNLYVNDCIKMNMTVEQPLYFSENCFGTADAISFENKHLYIFDFKSGETQASMSQLLVYAAIFCLEYNVEPDRIFTELRLYQNNQVIVYNPDFLEIKNIMQKIIDFDEEISNMKGDD